MTIEQKYYIAYGVLAHTKIQLSSSVTLTIPEKVFMDLFYLYQVILSLKNSEWNIEKARARVKSHKSDQIPQQLIDENLERLGYLEKIANNLDTASFSPIKLKYTGAYARTTLAELDSLSNQSEKNVIDSLIAYTSVYNMLEQYDFDIAQVMKDEDISKLELLKDILAHFHAMMKQYFD